MTCDFSHKGHVLSIQFSGYSYLEKEQVCYPGACSLLKIRMPEIQFSNQDSASDSSWRTSGATWYPVAAALSKHSLALPKSFFSM